MQLPDWRTAFHAVCTGDGGALQWDLVEGWVHAELYAELARRASSTGWRPFHTEVPYVTAYPVQLPQETNRDWKGTGAVKWVDLCLHSEDYHDWCWFECKVRHTGEADRFQKAASEAREAFRKDVVALMGFDAEGTADVWATPDMRTRAYWFEDLLKPHVAALRFGRHHFAAAFLQLDGELDPGVWGKEMLTAEIREWLSYRSRQAGRERTCPEIRISSSAEPPPGNHSLLVCEWSQASQAETRGG